MKSNLKVKNRSTNTIIKIVKTHEEEGALAKKADEKTAVVEKISAIEKKSVPTKVSSTKKNSATEKIPTAETVSEVEKEKAASMVSFVMVSKIKLCFRECASIVKVASETGCLVEIASGTKSGDSDSILSLVNLAVTAGQSLVLKIHGENNREAFYRISKILSGEVEADVELQL